MPVGPEKHKRSIGNTLAITMKQIDLNCDVGEGLQNEKDLFPFISSCSIACGGHAGDKKTMASVVSLALQYGVKIGAHPSYPDRQNFGRKSLKLTGTELMASIRDQINSLMGVMSEKKAVLHHIKPHGALYNDLAKDRELVLSFLEAIAPLQNNCKLYAPYGSVIALEAKKAGWPLFYEAFGDRNYNPDLSLVSRTLPQALIREPEKVLDHILPMILHGKVHTCEGVSKPMVADTICIHGDTEGVLEILMYLDRELPKNNIHIG